MNEVDGPEVPEIAKLVAIAILIIFVAIVILPICIKIARELWDFALR